MKIIKVLMRLTVFLPEKICKDKCVIYCVNHVADLHMLQIEIKKSPVIQSFPNLEALTFQQYLFPGITWSSCDNVGCT